MNIGNIITGHVNEFFGLNKDLVRERKKICKTLFPHFWYRRSPRMECYIIRS